MGIIGSYVMRTLPPYDWDIKHENLARAMLLVTCH